MKFHVFIGFIFVSSIFFLGIFIGNYVATKNYSHISSFLRNAELNAESFLIEQDFFEGFDHDCDLIKKRLSSFSSELYQLGKLLGTETAKKDLGENNYAVLKKQFHLMQIRTYLLTHKLKKECVTDSSVILFFFGKNDPYSKEQGEILDELVKKFNLHVFAIEFNFAKELYFLQDYYGVKETPFLVIDYDESFSGIVPYEKLDAVISSNKNEIKS